MNIEALRALVEQRRSIRGYDEKRDVTDEMIGAILNCARWAPSGGNGRPWELIVVRDQATRYQIADCYMKQMEQKREMDLAVRGTAKMTGDGFRRAPVLVILGDPSAPPRRALDDMIHRESYDMSKFRDDAMMEKFVKILTLQGR